MTEPIVAVCPKRDPKFPVTAARCSCGYVCSATNDDSADAALFAHVMLCHTGQQPHPARVA